MKVNVSFMSYGRYKKLCDGIYPEWFWMFRRYTYVRGFILRICGVYINVRERNATEKLIKFAAQA